MRREKGEGRKRKRIENDVGGAEGGEDDVMEVEVEVDGDEEMGEGQGKGGQ